MEKIELKTGTYVKTVVMAKDDLAIPTEKWHVLEIIDLGGDVVFVYVPHADWSAHCAEQSNQSEAPAQNKDAELLEEALETRLNNDPFGGLHSGQTLREIWETDAPWLERAVKTMRNTYITDRIKRILKAVENGTINF